MKKIILILLASVTLLFITGQPLKAGEVKTVKLEVTGMTCGLCTKAVKRSISSVEGVEKVEVSYKKKEARVEYDTVETNVKEIINAVSNAGYGAHLKTEGQ